MKTLHLYLTRQVLQTLGMTVLVCTGVLLLANGLREILPLLVERRATIGGVLHAIALLIPYVLVFSLPMGLLTATLLVFGRLSADQEYTAIRAGGISLVAFVTPVLLLSLGLCGVSAWVNMELGPRCRVEFKRLLAQFAIQQPTAAIVENRFITEFDGLVIYVGKRNGEQLENVLLNMVTNNEVMQSLRAPEGSVTFDRTNNLIWLRLLHAQAIVRESKPKEAPATNAAGTNASSLLPGTNSTAVSNAPLPALEDSDTIRPGYGDFTIPIELKKMSDLIGLKPKISEMSMHQLLAEKREIKQLIEDPVKRAPMLSVVDVQIHRQISFSFACLGFTLVGIPLGIRGHRKETAVGIGIGIALVVVYYAFIVIGQSMDTRPGRFPHLIVWIPTFLFQIVGAAMLWRANRKVA